MGNTLSPNFFENLRNKKSFFEDLPNTRYLYKSRVSDVHNYYTMKPLVPNLFLIGERLTPDKFRTINYKKVQYIINNMYDSMTWIILYTYGIHVGMYVFTLKITSLKHIAHTKCYFHVSRGVMNVLHNFY